MADTKTRQYEAMFLFGTSAAANLDATLDRVRKLVEGGGGEIMLLKKFDERRLAYEIKKQKRGLYVLCYYKGLPDTVAKITREVNLSDDVLRLMVISADHLGQAEMEAVQPQKYEPYDPEAARPRRPRPDQADAGREDRRPSEGGDGESDNDDQGDDDA